jgi:hypothetical protein
VSTGCLGVRRLVRQRHERRPRDLLVWGLAGTAPTAARRIVLLQRVQGPWSLASPRMTKVQAMEPHIQKARLTPDGPKRTHDQLIHPADENTP